MPPPPHQKKERRDILFFSNAVLFEPKSMQQIISVSSHFELVSLGWNWMGVGKVELRIPGSFRDPSKAIMKKATWQYLSTGEMIFSSPQL